MAERGDPVRAAGGGVSVVLPHRNHADHLGATLARLAGQSQPPIEIIVIDDASDLDQRHTAAALVAACPTARLIALDEWLGVNGAVQCGLAAATGEFVYPCAADDLIEADFLGKAVAALEACPEAAFAFSEPAELSADSSERRHFSHYLATPGSKPRYLSPAELEALLRRAAFSFSTNTIVYRRDALAAAGGFDPALRWHADWTAAHIAALSRGALFIPEYLAYHRVTAGSYGRAWRRHWTGRTAMIRAVLEAVEARSPEAAGRLRRAAVLPEYDLRLIPFLLFDPVGRRYLRPALIGRIIVRHLWSLARPLAPLGLRRRLRQAVMPS